MSRIIFSLVFFSLLFPLTSFSENIPTDAEDIKPLGTGVALPDAQLRTADGKDTSLKSLAQGKKTVLVFYRGGWCPYCNTYLGELQELQSEIMNKGYQILALSPDRPEKVSKSIKDQNASYTLLSDSKMNAAKALGVAFRLDDATVKTYKSQYSIDLEADSGEKHHLLPVPSAFVIDAYGQVTFAHSNPDYKVRISKEELLKALN